MCRGKIWLVENGTGLLCGIFTNDNWAGWSPWSVAQLMTEHIQPIITSSQELVSSKYLCIGCSQERLR